MGAIPRRVAVPVLLAIGGLAVIIALRSGSPYRLHLRVDNASQIVKGNLVEVGGLKIGTVDHIGLADDGLADIRVRITDDRFSPLHEGTRGVIRSGSVSGVANRYIAIEPGPNSSPKLDDDATVSTVNTSAETDLDAVLSTLDSDTRQKLQETIQGSDASVALGGAAGLNASLKYLDPALSQIQGTLGELVADRGALQRFIVASSGVVSAIADRRGDLAHGLASAATTAGALATQRRALTAVLADAPQTLSHSGRTLASLAGSLDELRPTVDLAAPVAPRLSHVLTVATPALQQTATILPSVRGLLTPLRSALAGLPSLRTTADPSLSAATTAIKSALPIVTAARAAFPDIALGATNGFGGTSAGYYDANGDYARIAFVSTSTPLVGTLGNLIPDNPNSGVRWHNIARCPGGAGDLAPDHSNEFDPGYSCDQSERP